LQAPAGRRETVLAHNLADQLLVGQLEGGSEGGGSVCTFACLHYFEMTVRYTLGN
jgi:hypothetical protein